MTLQHPVDKVSATLHAIQMDCAEIDRLVERVAEYRRHGNPTTELLNDAINDLLGSPAQQRLRRHLAEAETWAQATLADARKRRGAQA